MCFILRKALKASLLGCLAQGSQAHGKPFLCSREFDFPEFDRTWGQVSYPVTKSNKQHCWAGFKILSFSVYRVTGLRIWYVSSWTSSEWTWWKPITKTLMPLSWLPMHFSFCGDFIYFDFVFAVVGVMKSVQVKYASDQPWNPLRFPGSGWMLKSHSREEHAACWEKLQKLQLICAGRTDKRHLKQGQHYRFSEDLQELPGQCISNAASKQFIWTFRVTPHVAEA